MAKSEYTLLNDDSEDRVYARVDDVFDIGILRVEEGLVINTHENDTVDFLGKYAIDERFLPRTREERP